MKIKVDEDLPAALARMLQANGHDAETVIQQKMGGWKDPQIWIAVQAEGRLLLTADKGFADVRIYPPGTHQGVILLRPDRDGIRPLVQLLESLLASYDLAIFEGMVTVVTPRGVRMRRP